MTPYNPVEEVLQRLRQRGAKVKKSGTGWAAQCPAHDDRNPSLCVGTGKNGRALICCQAGCATEDVIAALGLTMRDLFVPEAKNEPISIHPQEVAWYSYRDESGKILYQAVRYEPGFEGRKKDFRQRQPDGQGGWTWNIQGVRRVLYHLMEVLTAPESEPIWVCEGEKDCDRLATYGLTTTTNVGGAGKWSDDYNEALANRNVYLLPDNDKAGREHVRKIAQSLDGIARSIRIVALPNLPDKGDVSDWLDAGHTIDELRALAADTPPWPQIDPATGEIQDDATEEDTPEEPARVKQEQNTWPDELPPIAFYGLIGEVVQAIMPQTEADPAAVLITLLAGIGNIIGRGSYARVGATRHGTNLFAAIVGDTGLGRKGTSWDTAHELLVTLDPEWQKRIQAGGLSSGEGVIWAVRDKIEKLVQARDNRNKPIPDQFVMELVDPGIDDKRLFILETEFAGSLRVMTRDGNTLSPILRNAWDGSDLSALTKNSPARATEPHISIVAHITPEELLRCMSETESANGFANRFLWVCSKLSKYLPEGGEKPHYGDTIERLQQAVTYGRSAGWLQRTDRAKKEWAKVYPKLTGGAPGLLGMVTGRAAAQVLRLSVIYAMLDLAPAVDVEHLAAALAIWEYCEASAKHIFGDATGDPVADKILKYLRQADEGMSRSEIHQLFGNNAPVKRIDQALDTLANFKRAASTTIKTNGRPAELWRAV